MFFKNDSEEDGFDLTCQDDFFLSTDTSNTSQRITKPKKNIYDLVSSWLKNTKTPDDIINNINSFKQQGWDLIKNEDVFDKVLLGIAESSWSFAISELHTSVAYFQASISQFDLAIVERPNIENAESLMMLDSLEDLFRSVSHLSGSNLSSFGLVYLGWFLMLELDLLSEKISPTEYVLSSTRLTTHFNHQVVALKGTLLRQSLPQVLTSKASLFLPK